MKKGSFEKLKLFQPCHVSKYYHILQGVKKLRSFTYALNLCVSL